MGLSSSIAGLCLTAAALTAQETSTPPFRAEVNLVNVSATVRLTNGALLGDLTKSDFEVYENGVPKKIKFFARKTDLPLRVGLLIDVSDSQEHFLKRHDEDIKLFLAEVLRPQDSVFAICFGDRLRLVADSANSPQPVLDDLREFARGSRHFPQLAPDETRDGGTALFDAVYAAGQKFKGEGPQRQALLLFSDGEDNSSSHDLIDALQAVQDHDVIVFCIGYTQKKHGKLTARNHYGIRTMTRLAELSGGSVYDGTAEKLGDVFNAIGGELRSLYDIGFQAGELGGDKRYRRISVRVNIPDAVVRTKSGYYPH